MRAVLRIAFSYFSFLPLQRWVNALGALLLAAGMVAALLASTARDSITMSAALGLPGAILIVISPIAAGGYALRYASSRSLLHLRPHGRLRMLLGTTLAVTLVACVMSLPILATHHFIAQLGDYRRIPAAMQPSAWFLGTWAFASAGCLIMFVASSSRALTMMMPALFFAIFLAGQLLGSLSIGLYTVFALILSAWIIFAIWYWRAAAVKRPTWMNDRSPMGFGNFVIGPLERLSLGSDGKSARNRLKVHLLGSTSTLAHAAIGAFPALLMIVLTTTMAPQKARAELVPVTFIFALTFVAAALGYMIARRARLLWLKAGLDRAALFRLVERLGLQTSLLTFAAGATLLLAASIPGRQEFASLMLLYTAVLAVQATSLFYLGLSFTRGWKATDISVGIAVALLVIPIPAAINPVHSPSVPAIGIVAGLCAIMALLLRWRAMRHWRVIDWRVAQLPKMGWMGR